jgi:hypothetical protein
LECFCHGCFIVKSIKQTLSFRRFRPHSRELKNLFHRRAFVFELVKQMFANQAVVPRPTAAILWRQSAWSPLPKVGID